MPTVLPHRIMESPTQADLDFLDVLTSDHASMGPLPAHHVHGPDCSHEQSRPMRTKPVKSLPRRDGEMDALMLSAVLSGSGPVSRHHFGHGSESSSSKDSLHHHPSLHPAAGRNGRSKR